MKRAAGKAERLLQIEALLLAHPDGLTQAEIARRIGVNRSTVYRCLPDLEQFCVYEKEDGRLVMDSAREANLPGRPSVVTITATWAEASARSLCSNSGFIFIFCPSYLR